MITWVKLLLLFTLSTMTGAKESHQSVEIPTTLISDAGQRDSDDPKTIAFYILENKCNVCHRKRNKRRVFTREKMDGWANDVYEQVFLRKRMPQGRKIKLTPEEYQDLQTWISSTKTKKDGN